MNGARNLTGRGENGNAEILTAGNVTADYADEPDRRICEKLKGRSDR